MSITKLALVIVLALCLLVHGVTYYQIRQRMLDRHSDAYIRLEKLSWGPGNGLLRFLLYGNVKSLQDPVISRDAVPYRIATVAFFAGALAIGLID